MEILETIKSVGSNECLFWFVDECTKGGECFMEHHPNLDSELFDYAADAYTVFNETNIACQKCLNRMYPARSQSLNCFSNTNSEQCDKFSRRPGADDLCSECRWFGGEDCKCVLVKSGSYNDQIWRTMISRGKDFNSALPKYKPGMKEARENPLLAKCHRTKA